MELGEVGVQQATATVDVEWEDNLQSTVGNRLEIYDWDLIREDGKWKLDDLRLMKQASPSVGW